MEKITNEKIIQELQYCLYENFSTNENDIKCITNIVGKMLYNYDVFKKETSIITYDDSLLDLFKKYMVCKKIDGLSDDTIKQYLIEARGFFKFIKKNYVDITTDDVKYYIGTRNVSKTTLNNKIRYLNSFFSWLYDEEIITKNPLSKIKKIKEDVKVKKKYTDSELEVLRNSVDCPRDRAIIETLYSTGLRVSELCSLNINDIKNNEAIVRGKGNKERIVYFSETAMYHIRKYMETRTDDNESLFVSLRAPYTRIKKGSVESRMRELGKKCGIESVHPHRFRRTIATNLGERGVPIQEIQSILGHSNINTTMIYVNTSNENAKHSHHLFV